jgi:hypothetical protein
MKLKVGDTVRVVGSRGTAKIRAILTAMHGALLEKQIVPYCGPIERQDTGWRLFSDKSG